MIRFLCNYILFIENFIYIYNRFLTGKTYEFIYMRYS